MRTLRIATLIAGLALTPVALAASSVGSVSVTPSGNGGSGFPTYPSPLAGIVVPHVAAAPVAVTPVAAVVPPTTTTTTTVVPQPVKAPPPTTTTTSPPVPIPVPAAANCNIAWTAPGDITGNEVVACSAVSGQEVSFPPGTTFVVTPAGSSGPVTNPTAQCQVTYVDQFGKTDVAFGGSCTQAQAFMNVTPQPPGGFTITQVSS